MKSIIRFMPLCLACLVVLTGLVLAVLVGVAAVPPEPGTGFAVALIFFGGLGTLITYGMTVD
jgi:hypothetical protein